ncbi:DUF554 domain-containing protein [Nosocomiicoccus ampullae]|uniref:DUF554 domain-containing protein n=1 Tax=Nosocomiicoccus ampullae TaxID=489910 RepID=A0A9Q2CZU6_9STAP|nr:DUF554 domain-containing protein [Nosocomiicoccus ampullae]MBB5176185.1 hypothetical protein [Nosocomiicoccus ampullae]QYA47352.1 DUF554 domain-containing protein [Nosocomiicoccus ampullae]
MLLLGPFVNGLAIIIGGSLGLIFTFIPEHMKDSILKAQGLVVIGLGIQMISASTDVIITLLSLIIGVVIGEILDLEGRLNGVGHWLEFKLGDKNAGNISQGLVSGSMIFIIGAMGIVGGLDAGMRGDNTVFYTKSFMDFFIALVMTTTYGLGVIISGIPAFLYEALITLGAKGFAQFIPESVLSTMTKQVSATGGVIIFAIGLNMMNVTKTRVGNMIPAIFVAMIAVYIISLF